MNQEIAMRENDISDWNAFFAASCKPKIYECICHKNNNYKSNRNDFKRTI